MNAKKRKGGLGLRDDDPRLANALNGAGTAVGAVSEEGFASVENGSCGENKCSFDLFGEPVLDPRPVGRPRHEPTEAQRRRVRELRAAGATHVAIAAAIGISHPTLVLNYFAELGSNSQLWRRRTDPTNGGPCKWVNR